MNRIIGILSGVAIASMLTTAANAFVVTANCRVDNVAAASGYADIFTTSSSSFVDVPGLEVAVRLLGAPADCILVNLAASVQTSGGTYLIAQAWMDGHIPGRPPEIILASPSHTTFETGPEIFLFDQPAKGAHSIKIRIRSSGGAPVSVRNRAMQVIYKGQ